MREVGILGTSEDIDNNFDDIQDISISCRFTNCGHTKEPGCAVLQAIKGGKLLRSHYQNYMKIKTESEVHQMPYTNKRKKGKTF